MTSSRRLTRSTWTRYLFLVVVGGVLILLATCGRHEPTSGTGRQIFRLVHTNRPEDQALALLARTILQDRLGYEVQTSTMEAGPLFAAMAAGDADAFLDAWLPNTHGDYLKQYGRKLTDLGIVYRGVRLGLVVPDYAPADTIADLNRYSDQYGGQIVGVDPEADIMSLAARAIQVYGLQYDLVPSSGPAMTTSLEGAIDEDQPIVVTGWRPNWRFARWSLRFLADPKNVFGHPEDIHVITRQGLDKDLPRAVSFLKNFRMTDEQLSSLMDAIHKDPDEPRHAARQWMRDHPDLIGGWIAGLGPVATASPRQIP